MKICLAEWAPFYAGAEVAAERLAVGLREAGVEVVLIVGTDGEALLRARQAGLRAEFVPLALTDRRRPWRFLLSQRRLQAVLRRERPDIVHANDLPTLQMVARAAGRVGVPRLCHHRYPFDGEAIAWMMKYGVERHVFVSQGLRNEMCETAPWLALQPQAVVYDGLPLPNRIADSDRRAARVTLGLPLDKVVVLFAGQIVERKGVADLLHAWSMLPTAVREISELYIIGDDLQGTGRYRESMELLAREFDLTVRFMGFRRDVPIWLTACDFVAVPSHVEPLGNATLEAMAHGRPVVGSATGGIPEMVVDGVTGLLVAPKSPAELSTALQTLIADEQQRHRYGAAGRARCEALFSLEAHVEAMVQEYRSLLTPPVFAALRPSVATPAAIGSTGRPA